jgi:uncharacterized cupredoxin-like copper-binding protein
VRLSALLLTTVLALGIIACGDDDEDSDSGGGGEQTAAQTETKKETAPKATGGSNAAADIDLSEFKLTPADVSFDKPGRHEFRAQNVGTTIHALEIEGNGVNTETTGIAAGKSDVLAVADLPAGKYKLYCPVGNHEARGMVGTVTVGGGSSGGAAAPETETESESGDDSGGGRSGY